MDMSWVFHNFKLNVNKTTKETNEKEKYCGELTNNRREEKILNDK